MLFTVVDAQLKDRAEKYGITFEEAKVHVYNIIIIFYIKF